MALFEADLTLRDLRILASRLTSEAEGPVVSEEVREGATLKVVRCAHWPILKKKLWQNKGKASLFKSESLVAVV